MTWIELRYECDECGFSIDGFTDGVQGAVMGLWCPECDVEMRMVEDRQGGEVDHGKLLT